MPKKTPAGMGVPAGEERLVRLGVLPPASARAPELRPREPNLKNRPKEHNNVKGLSPVASSAGVPPVLFVRRSRKSR
jgi:hypothetical protein